MKPGDKVICIDDTFRHVSIDQQIRKGEVYTVRSYGPYRHYIDGDYYGVRLEEIYRGADPAGYDPGDMPYRASRFKPVVSPKIEKTLEVCE